MKKEETLQQYGRPSDVNVFSQQLKKKNTQEHDLPKRRAIMFSFNINANHNHRFKSP